MKYTRNCTKCDKTIEHKNENALNTALRRIETGLYKGHCKKCRAIIGGTGRGKQQSAKIKEFNIYLQNCGNQCIPYQVNGHKPARSNDYIRTYIMEFHHGKKPFKGAVIRHLCPNDSTAPGGFVCCNPRHLEWNTHRQNILDHFSLPWGNRK
jgi:hypothetical protein